MFTFSLNGKPMSLDDLIGAIKEYGEKLPEKAAKIGDEAAEELRELAAEGFNGAGYDDIIKPFAVGQSTPDVAVEKKKRDDGTFSVVANGKEAIFVEFGAGVYYNGPAGTSPHPWGDRGPYYIGEYGKGRGKRKVWYFYDDNGVLRATRGTPASMPMYHAAETVRQDLPDIGRKVFKDGDEA